MTPVFFRVDQRSPTPVSTYFSPKLSFRYAFDRSSDSIKANEPGQDYLTICAEGQRLAFVLRDGVSQSFFGDLAARVLGEGLIEWLWAHGPQITLHNPHFGKALGQLLNNLTESAASQVVKYPLPDGIPSMLQVVLEKKRAIGSEAMFAAGYLDLNAQVFSLAWMGDIRLRVWSGKSERTEELLGAYNFQTRERWSTNRGLLGELHTAQFSTNEITRVLAYSDGLAVLDRKINRGSPSNATLESLIMESKLLSTSDDVSLVEVWLGEKPSWDRLQPKAPRRVKASIDRDSAELATNWTPVSQATGYELALISPQSWRLMSTHDTHWVGKVDALPPQLSSLAVRAWREEEAGSWSSPVPIHIPMPAIRSASTGAEAASPFLHDQQPALVGTASPAWVRPGPRRHNRLRITLVGLIFIALTLLAVIVWAQTHQVVILPGTDATATVTVVNTRQEMPFFRDPALVSTFSPLLTPLP